MFKTPKTSTAILLALSLAQPLPVVAQGTLPEGAVCADGQQPPCAEGVGVILPDVPAAEPQAPAEAEAPAGPVTEQPVTEAPVAEQPAEQPADQGAEKGTEQDEAEQATAGQPAPDQPVAGQPAPEAAPETASEPATVAAGDSAGQPVAEEPAPQEPAAPEAAGESPVEQAEQPVMPPAPTEAGTPAEPAATPAAADPAPVVQDGASEAEAEQARQVLEVLGASGAATEGEAELPAAAAAATGGEAEAATTVETEITEADTRQSSEDFATTAAGVARSGGGNGRGGGMSDFEKAALVGLGVLAVGAMLRNGDEVVSNTGDRVVMRRGNDDYYVLKDDDALLRRPGSTVRTESFRDGSTRTTVTREDGSRIVTIRDASGRALRRSRIGLDGHEVLLIDDTETYAPVEVSLLPPPAEAEVALEQTDPLALRLALERAARDAGRSFSLRQIRDIDRVRKLVPEIVFRPVTFATGSAAIETSEAGELLRLGELMARLIVDNPNEVFLIEGHTDAVGSAASNLALSDRRAESLALALSEYFDVPPENMVVQGYGESDLKVASEGDERANRRVVVRRITPLLDQRFAGR